MSSFLVEASGTQEDPYLLLKRFSMPTEDGSRDAISVSARTSEILLSLYTMMMETIVLQVWCLIVLFGMAYAIRRRIDQTSNMGVANIAIWNQKGSPLDVALSIFDYRSHLTKSWYSWLWVILALLAWAGSLAIPTLLSGDLVIASAAPVNPKAVFIPGDPVGRDVPDVSYDMQIQTLESPANRRAIDVLQAINSTSSNQSDIEIATDGVVSFTSTLVSDTNQSAPVHQFDYSYVIRGYEFGLQHVPDLQYSVNGTCTTVYTWFTGSSNEDGAITDSYAISFPADNGELQEYSTSAIGGQPPLLRTYIQSTPLEDHVTNISFIFAIDSVGRKTFRPSNDPWYATEEAGLEEDVPVYRVKSGRPVLFCSQRDIWTVSGKDYALDQVGEALPQAIVDIMNYWFPWPRIQSLAQILGSAALESTRASVGLYFDGGTASVRTDLQRLVLGAYMSSKSAFLETTLFQRNSFLEVGNGVTDQEGAGDFIVINENCAALSIRFLILVPVLLAAMSILSFILGVNQFFKWPWNYVHAMQSTILYSSIDTDQFQCTHDDTTWRRLSTPYHLVRDRPASIQPKYDHVSQSWHWFPIKPQETVTDGETKVGQKVEVTEVDATLC